LDHLGEVPDYYTKLKKVEEAHTPHTIHLVHGTAQTYDKVKQTWKVDRHDYNIESGARKKTLLNRALAKLKKDYPHHAEHEVSLKEAKLTEEHDAVEDVATQHGYKFSHKTQGGDSVYKHSSGHRLVDRYDGSGHWAHYGPTKHAGQASPFFSGGWGGRDLNKHLSLIHKHLSKHHGVSESVLLEFQKDDLVTIHYGAHNHEPHRVTAVHPGNKFTILPTRPRGRANRYPGGELTVDRSHLHPFEYQITELHDEPDRPGVGIGVSHREGMSMTEEPRKTLRLSKADWDHHTRHATAQYDHEGKPWIVQKDPSGAAIRIPVQITEEEYPHRATIWKVLKEALPNPQEREDNAPPSKTSEIVKGAAKKDKPEKKDDASKLSIGKTKDTFEPEPVLTPVLSIANMPGGAVK
jgi:hypothetical protein